MADVHVGQDCGGRAVVVSDDDVARYREGTDAPGLSDDWAPALLYHSEVYRDLHWYLPAIIGNLHARQEWELFHPFRVGETIRSRSTVVERYRKRNRDYVVNEVLWTTADGRWLQRSRTHQSFLADDPQTPTTMVVDRERERRGDRRFALPDTVAHDALAPAPRTITHAMCAAFSGPGKNYHTDAQEARNLGFPDIVVQGMLSVCLLADALAARFGAGWRQGGKLDVRLVNVVWPGDTLTPKGAVRERQREGQRWRTVVDVWCEKADGTVAIIGAASGLDEGDA